MSKFGTTLLSFLIAAMLASSHTVAQTGTDIFPPRPVYNPAPEYSEMARKAKFQGSCRLHVLVGADGTVHEVTVERPLGMGLDEKAVEAVRTWRFRPALKDGRAVAKEISIEVTFRLGAGNDAQKTFLNAVPALGDIPISTTVKPCVEPLPNQSGQPNQMQVTVMDLTFEGAEQVPIQEQNRIASSIKNRQYAGRPDGATSDVLDLLREEWQNRGYFKVQVRGDSEVLTSNPINSRIAIYVRIDEGDQYRLGTIMFRGNKALTDAQALRDLFPIKDGDVFSRKQVAEGLDNLMKAYKTLGYANATFVPTTDFNDDDKTVSIDIDVDEGKQFYVSSINLIGEDQNALGEASKDLFLKVGQVYNQRLLDLFAEKYPYGNERNTRTQFHFNEREGTIALILDLRHCQRY